MRKLVEDGYKDFEFPPGMTEEKKMEIRRVVMANAGELEQDIDEGMRKLDEEIEDTTSCF